MSDAVRAGSIGRIRHWATLAGLAAVVLPAVPSSASAAACPNGSTSWLGPGDGDFNDGANWTNGSPSASCDTVINAAGTYTVTMTGGAAMKSLAFGGPSGTQTLRISEASANTNLVAPEGISVGPNAAIVLDCPVLGCFGGSGSGPRINVASATLTNQGTITVTPEAGSSSGITGNVANTGTLQLNGNATHTGPSPSTLLNQGTINVANGKAFSSSGSSCGDTTISVFNDAGGQIKGAGTGTLSAINYKQGDGTTSGITPVTMPCGALTYSGNGASSVLATGGINLSGTVQANQSLAITATTANANIVATAGFVNKGAIVLDCPVLGCFGGSGGAPRINVASATLTNQGTITVTPEASGGAGITGNVTNTGTLQLNGDATHFGGTGPTSTLLNQGTINIANGKTFTSTLSSCGDPSVSVFNDSGGQITGTGSGNLNAVNYKQGAGTTSGAAPVTVSCGTLTYSGNGASSIVAGGINLIGNVGSAQALRIASSSTAPGGFSNAGTIAIDPSAALSTSGGTLVNTGRLAGGGTVTGSVNNSSGTVAPGAGPGTLTVSGDYSQGAGGKLELEVEGTGAGQFDKLAVGGNAPLGGTLALLPSAGYAGSVAIGDSIGLLTYAGTRTGPFGSTTTTPALACPKQFAAAYDDGSKKVNAVVSDGACTNGGGGGGGSGGGGGGESKNPPPAALPNTFLGAHPGKKVKTKKSKAKVKFAFTSDVAGATFECKLDKQAYAPCTSPKSYKSKPGSHKFSVRAVTAAAVDAGPAEFSFKVVKKK